LVGCGLIVPGPWAGTARLSLGAGFAANPPPAPPTPPFGLFSGTFQAQQSPCWSPATPNARAPASTFFPCRGQKLIFLGLGPASFARFWVGVRHRGPLGLCKQSPWHGQTRLIVVSTTSAASRSRGSPFVSQGAPPSPVPCPLRRRSPPARSRNGCGTTAHPDARIGRVIALEAATVSRPGH